MVRPADEPGRKLSDDLFIFALCEKEPKMDIKPLANAKGVTNLIVYSK